MLRFYWIFWLEVTQNICFYRLDRFLTKFVGILVRHCCNSRCTSLLGKVKAIFVVLHIDLTFNWLHFSCQLLLGLKRIVLLNICFSCLCSSNVFEVFIILVGFLDDLRIVLSGLGRRICFLNDFFHWCKRLPLRFLVFKDSKIKTSSAR